jgi:hypothetical protein
MHTDDKQPNQESSDEQLETTAEHWREGHEGSEAEESAIEVAEGADRAAEQPGFGREGQ